MLEPARPKNETARLQALRLLDILDTSPEQRFDRITRIAQRLFEVPIALVSLVDTDRQWFKSCQGLSARETPRSISFCGHAILSDEIFCIPDASRDTRFSDNPLVTGPPNIRFYAGAPLQVADGLRIGTLCIIDRRARTFTMEELADLRSLADWVQDELNMVKLAEATTIIQAQEARLRALLSNIADAIITIDAEAVIKSVNAPATTMFSLPPDDLIGRSVNQFLPDFSVDTYLDQLQRQASEEVAAIPRVNRTTAARSVNAHEFPVDVTVTGMHLPEGMTYIVSIRDISEAKRLEMMKREFVSIVSHELRTPLTAIRGALGLVVGGVAGELPDKAREMLGIAERNSERLIDLVNDILILEKIELGRLTFEMKDVDVRQMLEKAVELNNDYAVSFGVQLELCYTLDTEVKIHADEDRLLQALTNLISNAVKHSPTGERVSIEVSWKRPGELLRFLVRDNGPGIPADMRTRIFEKFQQADSPGSRAKGGTGLGLSIAKAIVEAFGGIIAVECPEAGGSEFHFDLPVPGYEGGA